MKNKAFDNTSKALLNKSCPLSGKDAPIVDYKNINLITSVAAINNFVVLDRAKKQCIKL